MRKIILFTLLMSFVCSCATNIIDDSESKINDPNCPYAYSRVNIDASSQEIFSAITQSGDTLAYYGDKNADGTTASIKTLEYIKQNGESSIIDFDSYGKLNKITSSEGASIEFEWLTETTAVVKAYSSVDHLYLTTTFNISETNKSYNSTTKAKTAKTYGSRNGQFHLDIHPCSEQANWYSTYLETKASYDKGEIPGSQEIWLSIYQCGASYDAKNYLILRNASNGVYIGKLTNYERLIKGTYIYQLPTSSYPTEASNQKLCADIDSALREISKYLGGALDASGSLILALNSAAFMTGIGVIPTVITDAIIFAGTLTNCGLQILDSFGGIAGLMQRTNSEWYYKEYIISDLALYPVGYNKNKTVMGERHTVNPTETMALLTLDMHGDPTINSFDLDPSYPSEGQSYVATADYHCIPNGSQITMDIVGTDGYKNMETYLISGSGTAELHVPGAESGVYDVCSVTIKLPSGESLYMQASLVFGN